MRTFEWPRVDDSRFASLITAEQTGDEPVVLIGLPDELGVKLNNGRPGAKDGPRVFRETLAKMGARYDLARKTTLDVRIFDAGDVVPAHGDGAAALEETHRRVTEAARPFHDDGKIVVGIGGGHDLTFPMVRALAQSIGGAVGGVNVDPHLDVRETPGSGMPYRSLIEGGFLDAARFVEFGTGRFDNSEAHIEWLRAKGGTIRDITGVRSGRWNAGEAVSHALDERDGFVSIDMDCVEGALCVSAVPALGVPIDTVLAFARLAGTTGNVRHFDLMELSPAHDIGNRTARLAAMLFQTFIAGVHERINA